MNIDDAYEEAKEALDKAENDDSYEDIDDDENEDGMIFSGELGNKKVKNEDGLPDEFEDSD